MEGLLKKINYRGQKRIALINADENFNIGISEELKYVITDREIDQRCPYEFMIIFVRSVDEIEHFAPLALHNLTADGILWFCYPKKTSGVNTAGPDRDHGWKSLNDAGMFGVRMVSINDTWSALRFRNVKFIKSTSGRFEHI